MKNRVAWIVVGLLAVSMNGWSDSQPHSDNISRVVAKVRSWSTDPELVAAVKRANTSGQTLEEVKAIDKEWQAYDGVSDFMQSLMINDAAQELAMLERSEDYFIELFLMDHHGSNVAMTNKTSDYWQGDEAKFKKTYPLGTSAVYVSEVEYDESVDGYVVQVSVPIIDGNTNVGALTVGVNLDEFDD